MNGDGRMESLWDEAGHFTDFVASQRGAVSADLPLARQSLSAAPTEHWRRPSIADAFL
jgi:hypothetical protein